jgi:quercetin dioxygenase-like cupin family protein
LSGDFFSTEHRTRRNKGCATRTSFRTGYFGHVTELNGKYKFRVSEVTYQPVGYLGYHNHPGPGVRVIMAGEFTYVKGDKTSVYTAGNVFLDQAI